MNPIARLQGDAKYVSAAAEASAVVATQTGRLFSVIMNNADAEQRYLQVFDAIALPADGAIPMAVVPVPSYATGSLDVSGGIPMATGIVVACSSTMQTLTISGDNDSLFTAVYRLY